MNIPEPADVSTANPTKTTTEPEAEPEPESVYDTLDEETLDNLRKYHEVVETHRADKKMAFAYLFDGSTDVKNADIIALVEDSPIAKKFADSRDLKNSIKDQFKKARKDGEIPNEVGLRGYKEWVGEPKFDHEELSPETVEDSWGLVTESVFYDNEDPIMVPDYYELPTNEEGKLMVWYPDEPETDEIPEGYMSAEKFLEIAENTDGIGEKTLARLTKNVEDAQ